MAKKIDVTKMLKRAEEALNRRNYGLAFFNYINALSLQPDNIDARAKLRATQTRTANERQSGGLFKFMSSVMKAHLLSLLGKKEEAIIACERALCCKPTSVGVMKLLASCAEESEWFEVAAWQLQEIADKHDREDINNLYNLGELYMEMERSQDAIKAFERIQEIDPDEDVDGLIRDASALRTSETYADAAKRGSHKIIEGKEESEFRELRSGKLHTDEQRLRAIKYLLDVEAKERPDDHLVYIQLGDIYRDLDDLEAGYAQAKECYDKAREMNEADSAPLDKLGDLEIRRMRRELKPLAERVKADPKAPEARAERNALRKKLLSFEVDEFERRTKAQPLKKAFNYRLGELYFQAKRFDDSIGQLQQATKDPKFRINSLTILGRCFHANGQYDMAITQFEKSREKQELFTKIRDSLYFEAMSWEGKGDRESLEQARQLYTRIYETDINYRDVKKRLPEVQKRIKALDE